MMAIGAVYVEVIILKIKLLLLCVDNLDILPKVGGYAWIVYTTMLNTFIPQARCIALDLVKYLIYPLY